MSNYYFSRKDYVTKCAEELRFADAARKAVKIVLSELTEDGKRCDTRFEGKVNAEITEQGLPVRFSMRGAEWVFVLADRTDDGYSIRFASWYGDPSVPTRGYGMSEYSVVSGIMRHSGYMRAALEGLAEMLGKRCGQLKDAESRIDGYLQLFKGYEEAANRLKEYVADMPMITGFLTEQPQIR